MTEPRHVSESLRDVVAELVRKGQQEQRRIDRRTGRGYVSQRYHGKPAPHCPECGCSMSKYEAVELGVCDDCYHGWNA